MAYFQLKFECLHCDTHYMICTNHPEQHDVDTTHCPRCGYSGISIQLNEVVDGDVEDLVPGNSLLDSVGRHIDMFRSENSQLCRYTLNEDVRQKISAGLSLD